MRENQLQPEIVINEEQQLVAYRKTLCRIQPNQPQGPTGLGKLWLDEKGARQFYFNIGSRDDCPMPNRFNNL